VVGAVVWSSAWVRRNFACYLCTYLPGLDVPLLFVRRSCRCPVVAGQVAPEIVLHAFCTVLSSNRPWRIKTCRKGKTIPSCQRHSLCALQHDNQALDLCLPWLPSSLLNCIRAFTYFEKSSTVSF
jgi:hypothetical protein